MLITTCRLVLMCCKQQCVIVMHLFTHSIYKCMSSRHHRILILCLFCLFRHTWGCQDTPIFIYSMTWTLISLWTDRTSLSQMLSMLLQPKSGTTLVWPVCLYLAPCAFLSVFAAHCGLELWFKWMPDASCYNS